MENTDFRLNMLKAYAVDEFCIFPWLTQVNTVCISKYVSTQELYVYKVLGPTK